MNSPRKRKKFFGNYILVKKKNGKVFIRKYPRDLAEWNKTKDPSKIHPNKLRTWINMAEVAREVRGKDYDTAMQTFIQKLTGRTVKQSTNIRVIPIIDIYGLKLQAIEKGIDQEYIDALVVPAEALNLIGISKRKTIGEKEIMEALEKLKNPLMVRT